jgi:anti-sigma regulatory factor (Ser/Thr protein kinase)
MQFDANIPVTTPAISALTEEATDFLAAHGVDARAAHHVALVLDEMLTNLATHGGAADQTVAVSISIEPERVRGEIVDGGPPFDPRATADPDVTLAIADRPVGGLGLLLVRRLTSALDYARRDDRNCTTFWVPRAAAGEQ